ncbi:Superoxide dismutase (Mn) 1 [Citrus sinensis]|uniref:Superoxide dismutase n=1 Tax=Citrus clementina TaxID=85681 RepID=V4THH1_CITCL|nr:hypothetical protein CICLE_v10032324mg [Citrus x clementina]KAH9702853.1 Superoxide dismutase (Mn) 1 [Citrus sinensis]
MALRSLATRKAIGLGKSVGLGLRGLQTVTLPDLPYDYSALEPAISGEIMQLHHQKHHQAYVTNYNKAVEQLFQALNKVDTSTVVQLQGAIKFNGGGHVNHSIFWKNLAPVHEGGGEPPHSSLGWAIDTHFGSLEALIQKMSAEGAALQGSGWVVSTVVGFKSLQLFHHCCWFQVSTIVSFFISSHCLYVSANVHLCILFFASLHASFWQWLGLDTEFKRLVVETTANQVIL